VSVTLAPADKGQVHVHISLTGPDSGAVSYLTIPKIYRGFHDLAFHVQEDHPLCTDVPVEYGGGVGFVCRAKSRLHLVHRKACAEGLSAEFLADSVSVLAALKAGGHKGYFKTSFSLAGDHASELWDGVDLSEVCARIRGYPRPDRLIDRNAKFLMYRILRRQATDLDRVLRLIDRGCTSTYRRDLLELCRREEQFAWSVAYELEGNHPDEAVRARREEAAWELRRRFETVLRPPIHALARLAVFDFQGFEQLEREMSEGFRRLETELLPSRYLRELAV
jgi:hypothetical protein